MPLSVCVCVCVCVLWDWCDVCVGVAYVFGRCLCGVRWRGDGLVWLGFGVFACLAGVFVVDCCFGCGQEVSTVYGVWCGSVMWIV